MGNGSFEGAPEGDSQPLNNTEAAVLAGFYIDKAIAVFMGFPDPDGISGDDYLEKAHTLFASINTESSPEIHEALSSSMVVAELLQWVRDELADHCGHIQHLRTILQTLRMDLDHPEEGTLN